MFALTISLKKFRDDLREIFNTQQIIAQFPQLLFSYLRCERSEYSIATESESASLPELK